MLWERIPM